MKSILLLVAFVGYAAGWVLPRPLNGPDPEDAFLHPMEILVKYGYPAENHTIQTDDGYLLTAHRIPYGRACGPENSKGPVIVQHGLFSSSVDWIITGTDHGLGYILADHCYDVWLTNSRGNTYSKAHSSLDIHSDKYWDFSWHEMGQYDLPAVVNYILHVTGWKDLLYIGHSQGTTLYFIFNSLYPNYSEKVRAGFMLAPVAFMAHSESKLLGTISKFSGVLGWITDTLGINQFSPHNDFIAEIGGSICSDLHPDLQNLCTNLVFVVCGFDSEQLNKTLIPIFLGHLPAGAATKQLLHYAQSFNSDKFRQFDYGFFKNLEKYGQGHPPDYDLSKMTIPTFLHYSKNDLLSAVKDVDMLANQMKNLEAKMLVQFDKFNHLDYVIANDVKELLYDTLLNLMDRFR